MRMTHTHQLLRKATNVSVRADILAEARELNLNLSQTLEAALIARIAERRREQWLEANQGAIEDYNARIERDGVFGDERLF